MVHGSPRQPIWEYLLSVDRAQDNFTNFDTKFCLVGHHHVPLIFGQNEACNGSGARIPSEIRLSSPSHRLIINPGRVGQPRGGDPRASYAIYDSNAKIVYHYRVDYDIASTQRKMAEHGLPSFLIFRLSHGY